MARAIVDGSGNVQHDTQAAWMDGANKTLPEVAAERLLMATAMYVRDELNLIRAVGLLGLSARSVDDVINGIKAKLT